MSGPGMAIERPDPLLCETPLPLRRTFYPLGYPATIATNCRGIIDAAESLWGKTNANYDIHLRPVELRLAVSRSAPGAQPPPAAAPRSQGHLISFIHDVQNWAVCDLRAGFAFGWLTQAVAHDSGRVRYHFVEPLISVMMDALNFSVVHAACVSWHGSGILLCGDSEAGKSTLAYACAKRGWTYICDDGAHIVRKADDRIVRGNCHQIRFRPPTAELFQELRGFQPSLRPNGKPTVEVDASALNIGTHPETEIDYVVFLNRRTGLRQTVASFDRMEALEQLDGVHCFGEESVRADQRASLRRLLAVPVLEMTYHDLDWAEARLRTLVESGD